MTLTSIGNGALVDLETGSTYEELEVRFEAGYELRWYVEMATGRTFVRATEQARPLVRHAA